MPMRRYSVWISLLLAFGGLATRADDFVINWFTVDGGGAIYSAGGGFQLGGTIGQPDAQTPPVMTGGSFTLTGGFWPGVWPFQLGDMNCNGAVNNEDIDGFIYALFSMAAEYDQYLHAFPEYRPCSMLNADFSGDGLVNAQDIDGFINALFNS